MRIKTPGNARNSAKAHTRITGGVGPRRRAAATGSGGSQPRDRTRPRPAPAARRRAGRDDLGGDERRVRRRGPGGRRDGHGSDLSRRRPPLRDRRDRRARSGLGDTVRGPAGRRARLAGRHEPAAEPDPDARSGPPAAARVRVVPRAGDARPRPRHRPRRPRRVRRAADPRRRGRVAQRAPAGRRPGLRGRHVARDAGRNPPAPRPLEAAQVRGGGLRGVHPALPRGVERAGHPLALLDRARLDDLRRPRHPRRLEHVGAGGAATCRRPTGGRSGSPAG